LSKATRRDLARALELHQAGRFADAEKVYAKYLALHPSDPAALNNAAAAAMQFGNPALAIARFEKLVALDPRHAQGYSNLGYALIHGGRSEDAVRCLERAVEIDPSYAMAHNNLGIAYENLFRRAEAVGAFERALALDPAYADPAANLGEVLNRDGDTEHARAALNRALAAQPSHIGARAALATTDALDGSLEDALATLERIVASAPRASRFWETLGSLRIWAGDLVGAEAAFRKALALDPHDRQAWLGVAGALLARGDFARGWRAFEERRDGCFGAPSRFGDIPQWDGGRLDGALLVTCEQGLGDVVQFARFIPDARRRVRRLIFLVDGTRQSLAPLLATLSGVDDLCTDAAALAALAERPIARASVLSLPYLVDVRVEALPGPVPYVSPLAERTAVWKPRLDAIPRPRVGLAWAAYARRDIGYVTRQKSVPLALLAPVIAASNASFVSLQLGAAGMLAPHGEPGERIVDLTADIHDFGDTAAIIAELDLVISSDTSVAHVAGALGKPIWMLDRYNTCWRWRLAADHSPWYPTMRIFRQQKFGDWSEPLTYLAAALSTSFSDAA
jgi:Flp pilus assembly protein TadD